MVSVEMASVAFVFAAIGVLVGVLIAGALYTSRVRILADQLGQKQTRIALIESLLSSSASFSAFEEEAPSPREGRGGVAVAETPSLPAQRPVAQDQAVRPVQRPVAPLPKPVPAAPVVPPSPPVAATAPPVAVAPVEAVSPEEVAAAVRASRVEGVSAEKAKVARLSKEGVHLSSGRLVRVGERFGSGEKLLEVDPQNSRVVTSERQLLLFFGG